MKDTHMRCAFLLAWGVLLPGLALAACSLDPWSLSVEAGENPDGSVTFTVCVQAPAAPLTCGLGHFDLVAVADPLRPGTPCGTIDPARTTNPACWGFGPDPSADACTGGADVWKYDCPTEADGAEHRYQLTLFGVDIACGDGVLKGGSGCTTVTGVPVPSLDPDAARCDPAEPVDPPEPCAERGARALTLTAAAWGGARHYEALACELLTTCSDLEAAVERIARANGWQGGILAEWVTGNCGRSPYGPDGGFLPSGFTSKQAGAAQLVAALLNVDGLSCHALQGFGGEPLGAVSRGWIVLSTGQTVGEVLDAAVETGGSGFAQILAEINASWDEGFDAGTVAPCEQP